MTIVAALNPISPPHPSAFGTVAEPSYRPSWPYLLVCNDSTETMEKNAGFFSINRSVPDISIPRQVEEQLDRLCQAAHDEQFEVGVESRFSKELQRLCAYSPTAVLESLRVRLIHRGASPAVLSEILQWVSRQEAGVIRSPVIELLSAGLDHPSSLVRDAAASALAYLDERTAVSHLRRALDRETVPELREDLEDLIRSLES